MYIEIFIAGFAIMLASLSGKLVMWGHFGNILQKNLKFLVTFAMGVFSTTLYLMLNETMAVQASISTVAMAAAAGALSLEVLHRLIPEAHHHHGSDNSECCEHGHGQLKRRINPIRILLGDAVHNIGDGIMLVPAYLVSLQVGLSVTVGILVHEIVQEVSEFFLLKEGGYSDKKALWSNFAVSSTIMIGIGASIFVAKATEYVHLLVAFTAGGILYIIIRDLLPHTLERIRHNGKMPTHLLMFSLGVGIMLFVAIVLPE